MKNTQNDREEKKDPKQARRDLLGNGALAAAGVMFGMVAAACGDDSNDHPVVGLDGGHDGGNPGGSIDGGGLDATVAYDASSDAGTGTDADIAKLNALLKAEYVAITAYTAGGQLISAAPSSDPLYSLATAIKDVAGAISNQHSLHAQALVTAINDLNGTPITQDAAAATFSAPAALTANPTITNVLKFAAGAERQAAVSYNTVLATMEAAKYRFLASAIEGDETQHFIVLAALVLGLAQTTDTFASNLPGSATKAIPQAFVHSFDNNSGLDQSPPDYFPNT